MNTTTEDVTRTLAVHNQKGGVGKTTATVNIGYGLARLGCRVLLVDCTSNHSLTTAALGITPGRGARTLADLVSDDVEDGDALHVLQAAPDAWQPKTDLGLADGGALQPGGHLDVITSNNRLQAAADTAGRFAGDLPLRRALAGVASTYDAVLIDTPDTTGPLARMSLVSAGWALTPVTAQDMAISDVNTQWTFLNKFARAQELPVRHVGVLVTMYDRREPVSQGSLIAALEQDMDTLVSNRPATTGRFEIPQLPGVTFGTVLPQVIPYRSAIHQASKGHQPMPSRNEAAQLYLQVAIEVLHLTHPTKAAQVVAMLDDAPVEGVWPIRGRALCQPTDDPTSHPGDEL